MEFTKSPMRPVSTFVTSIVKPFIKSNDVSISLAMYWPQIVGDTYTTIYRFYKVNVEKNHMHIVVICEKSQGFLLPYVEKQFAQRIKKYLKFKGDVSFRAYHGQPLSHFGEISVVQKAKVPESLEEALLSLQTTYENSKTIPHE